MSYQLRRVGFPASVEKVKNLYRIASNTTLIGRGKSVDIYLDSVIRKGLISRAHAQIIQRVREEEEEVIFELFDTSLNGTYVNDTRVNGSVILKDGDNVAFGHLQGALIEPGVYAPQKESEFFFKFEKCIEDGKDKEVMVDFPTNKKKKSSSSVFMSPKSPILSGIHHDVKAINIGSVPNSYKKTPKMMPPNTKDDNETPNMDEDDDFDQAIKSSIPAFQSPDKQPAYDKIEPPVILPTHPHDKLPKKTGQDSSSDNDIKSDTSLNLKHLYKKSLLLENQETTATPVKIKRVGEKRKTTNENSENEESENSEEVADNDSDASDFSSFYTSPKTRTRRIVTPKKLQVNAKRKRRDSSKQHEEVQAYSHDPCDAWDCKRPSGAVKMITWVQCDDCDSWYHVVCSGLTAEEAEKEDTNFRCGCQ